MHSFKSIKVIDSGKSIILQRNNDTSVRYHSTWLRDNALDPKTRDVNSGQRLITFSDIPINTSMKKKIFRFLLIGWKSMLMIRRNTMKKVGLILI